MENCAKGLKYAFSGREEIHPCVLQDIGPLGPLPCSQSSTSLDHSKQGIGYRWPCAIDVRDANSTFSKAGQPHQERGLGRALSLRNSIFNLPGFWLGSVDVGRADAADADILDDRCEKAKDDR